jgi:ribonucleoside-diphosphate reductase alpha chain
LAEFDLDRLARALVSERDLQFSYIGLQTLYDRYFLHIRGTRIEMPQAFYMRVAMGLALEEKNVMSVRSSSIICCPALIS